MIKTERIFDKTIDIYNLWSKIDFTAQKNKCSYTKKVYFIGRLLSMGETLHSNRKIKDTVFRMLFKEKKQLLELYNGINGTNYTNEEDLRINTLENAVYMNVKNDVSYVFRFEMNLYEHQSTLCPNMPLRNLFYVSKLLESELEQMEKKKSIYGSKLIKIPTPEFIVFYNGKEHAEERFEYKLSDAYISIKEDIKLELKVTVLNVNLGKNEELLEHCKTLKEYSIFVDILRKNLLLYDIDEAVEITVNYCIEEGILAEFLRKNKAEVIPRMIYECNIEEEMKKIGDDRYEDGFQDGFEGGKLKTEIEMIHKLFNNKGKSIDEIVELTDIDIYIVKEICEICECIEDENNVEEIYMNYIKNYK